MTDRKFRQIPLASFNYRHEAEFAAGFLRDAGIPYRLQIEDPALGMSATNSATVWVSAVDEVKARRVLDHDLVTTEGDDATGVGGAVEGGPTAEPEAASGSVAASKSRGPAKSQRVARSGGASHSQRVANIQRRRADAKTSRAPRLTLRQRVMALAGSVGGFSLLGLETVRETPWVMWGFAVLAVLLLVAGVLGRTLGPLRGILEALSGDAP